MSVWEYCYPGFVLKHHKEGLEVTSDSMVGAEGLYALRVISLLVFVTRISEHIIDY